MLDDQIIRTDDYKLEFVSEEAKTSYKKNLIRFCKGQINHIAYANNNVKSALPPLFCSGTSEQTDAFYGVSRVAQGKVLSEAILKDYSISEALGIGISLCEAIGRIHVGGKKNDCVFSMGLYLDCKPENIFLTDHVNVALYYGDFADYCRHFDCSRAVKR